MTGPKHSVEFFSEYSILIFSTQNSDFERNCAELLFTTKCFQKLQTRDPFF